MTTPTLTATAAPLDAEALRMLAGKTGPCITIVLPSRHESAAEGSRRAVLRGHLRSAERVLRAGTLAFFAETLLARVEEIGTDSALELGDWGWAIFRMPGFIACYRAQTDQDTLSIASHALLGPFVADAFAGRMASPAQYVTTGETILAELGEIRDPTRVATAVGAVLRAAAAGRVQHLCARMQTAVMGAMEPSLDRLRAEQEDLVNAAIVETLRTGGDVYMVPQDRLPASEPLAAILRI